MADAPITKVYLCHLEEITHPMMKTEQLSQRLLQTWPQQVALLQAPGSQELIILCALYRVRTTQPILSHRPCLKVMISSSMRSQRLKLFNSWTGSSTKQLCQLLHVLLLTQTTKSENGLIQIRARLQPISGSHFQRQIGKRFLSRRLRFSQVVSLNTIKITKSLSLDAHPLSSAFRKTLQ